MKEKEKKGKKIDIRLIIFVISIIFIAIVIGSFYYKRYQEENKIPENLNISSKYHYVPYKTLIKQETPVDKIEFREYQMICGNFDDLSCYVKNHPFSYIKDNEKYRLSLIRIQNDYLENIKVFYKRDNENEYSVSSGSFIDVNYQNTMKKKGNILVDISLDPGRYCFYIEASNKNNESIRSDIICKWIGPFDPEEDKFMIYGKSGYNELLLMDLNLDIDFFVKRLKEINGKLVIKDLENRKSFEFTPDEILQMQEKKSNIQDFSMFRNYIKLFFNEKIQSNATRVYLKKGSKLEDITLKYEELEDRRVNINIPLVQK